MPRIRFKLTIPPTSTMGAVFGTDGVLYWAKDWGDVEENADGDFEVSGYAKEEYIPQLKAKAEGVCHVEIGEVLPEAF